METHRGATDEVGELLVHLQIKLAELDRLRDDLADIARALPTAVHAPPGHAPGPASVYSVREAARELGVSTSMLHKLLKDGRLNHLKVGARTLITPEHLERFRAASEAEPNSSRGAGRRPPAVTPGPVMQSGIA